jgi:2-isopropylmalate synthase
VIRINSQSGKGGIAYILEQDYGLALPRRLQIEFSAAVQRIADRDGIELTPSRIFECFQAEYLTDTGAIEFVEHRTLPDAGGGRSLDATILLNGEQRRIVGKGNGPIDAYVAALAKFAGVEITIVDYREHATGAGADATAVAYVEAKLADGRTLFGVGMDRNIVSASLRAVTSAANRASHMM